jgi:hypothetical protein
MADEVETPTARLKYRNVAGKTYCYVYITESAKIAF